MLRSPRDLGPSSTRPDRGDEFGGIAVQAAMCSNEVAAARYTTRFSERRRGIVGGFALGCNEDGYRLGSVTRNVLYVGCALQNIPSRVGKYSHIFGFSSVAVSVCNLTSKMKASLRINIRTHCQQLLKAEGYTAVAIQHPTLKAIFTFFPWYVSILSSSELLDAPRLLENHTEVPMG